MEAGLSNVMGAGAPLQGVRSLAIVCPSWIGDTVMATPVFRAARQALGAATIVGIVRPGLDEVLRGTPWFDDLLVCNVKGALGPVRLARMIRRSKANAVLLLPNSFRSALGARFSSAARRLGYDRDGRGWLLTDRKAAPGASSPVPMIDYYAELAEFALGIKQIDRRIELATTADERTAADALLRDVEPPFVVLNPGANRIDKRWPAERFAAVADSLATLRRVRMVVSGSPGEVDVLAAVTRAARTPIINLAQRGVNLGSLKAVLERAALLITNDTGPRHIAAALGTPVVTLFGPTDHRWTTLHGVRERIVLAEPFLPEELIADRHTRTCVIEKISVADVIAAADALLSGVPNG